MTATLLIAVPLLGAFLLPALARLDPGVPRLLGPGVLVAHLMLVAAVGMTVVQTGPIHTGLGGFAAPAGIAWRVATLPLLFVGGLSLLALLLWPRGGPQPERTAALVLLLVGAGSGLALSADLFNLFVLLELAALAAVGLVVSDGGGASAAAGLRLLLLEAAASGLALLGIALVFAATGTLNLAQLATVAPEAMSEPLRLVAFALLLAGFGVKAELFPVNTWVPEVYGATSPRVAGILAGGVSKLALLAVLHLHVTAFAGPRAGALLLTVGALTVLAGAFAALASAHLPRLLGYSSIGQLGLVAMAFALPDGIGVAAGAAVGLHHLVVKPALFVLSDGWPRGVHALSGTARTQPVRAAVFALLVLSLVGVPPLPGFWAKLMLLQAMASTGGAAWIALALVLLLTVVEAVFLLPVVRRLYTPTEGGAAPENRGWWRALPLAAGVIAATVLAAPVGRGLDEAAGGYASAHAEEPPDAGPARNEQGVRP